jgi:hypothetical protein
MYPIDIPNVPAVGGEYVPYFYQRGLHQLYPLPSPNVPRPTYSSVAAVHGFAGVDAPFLSSDRPQTVEQIIQQGYFSAPKGDPLTAIISDKKHTSGLGLDDVISQIRRRYEIHDQILTEIELAKCAATNAIYQHEAYCGPASVSSKQRYAKHKAIQGMYEQEREEVVALWKDVSRLRTLLPENAQQYLAAYRKVAALNENPGDET